MDEKIKQRRADGLCVSIVREPEDKIYRISHFKRRRRDDNSPFRSVINKQVDWRERHFELGDECGC